MHTFSFLNSKVTFELISTLLYSMDFFSFIGPKGNIKGRAPYSFSVNQ